MHVLGHLYRFRSLPLHVAGRLNSGVRTHYGESQPALHQSVQIRSAVGDKADRSAAVEWRAAAIDVVEMWAGAQEQHVGLAAVGRIMKPGLGRGFGKRKRAYAFGVSP